MHSVTDRQTDDSIMSIVDHYCGVKTEASAKLSKSNAFITNG